MRGRSVLASFVLNDATAQLCSNRKLWEQAGEACASLTVVCRHFAKGGQSKPVPKKKTNTKLAQVPDGPKLARKHALAVAKQREASVAKLDPLSDKERAIYEAISGVPAQRGKLTSQQLLQNATLPWTEEEVASMMHTNLTNQAGGISTFMHPLEMRDMFQSAEIVADYIADMLSSDMNWGKVQRLFTQLLGHGESTFVRGLKIQIKGRLSVKAGKAASKEWQYGHTSMATFSDAVDYSEKTALTRAGYIGVKVWIRYHEHAFPGVAEHKKLKVPVSLSELAQLPRTQLPLRSVTAWWNRPGPLQPAANRTWNALAVQQGSATPVA